MDKFREECNNWNEVTELVDKLVQLVDTSKEKEALELRDKIYGLFTKEYSEPIWNYLNLEEELGCPLDIVFKALKNGIYTKESELDKELDLYDVRDIDLRGLGVISKICSYGECDFTRYYTDYKKTWWLKEDRSE